MISQDWFLIQYERQNINYIISNGPNLLTLEWRKSLCRDLMFWSFLLRDVPWISSKRHRREIEFEAKMIGILSHLRIFDFEKWANSGFWTRDQYFEQKLKRYLTVQILSHLKIRCIFRHAIMAPSMTFWAILGYVMYILYIKYWQSKHIKDFFEMRICDETRTATKTARTFARTSEIENDLVACNSCKIESFIKDVIIITEVKLFKN